MLTARAEAWSWGTTTLKLSLTIMIIRIKGDKRKWRLPLYAFSAFLVALAITSTIWNYTTCIPLEAAWDFSYPRTHCRQQKTNVLYLLVGGSKFSPSIANLVVRRTTDHEFSVLYTITDLIFAILPLLFILKMNRARREKIVLCFLMGLGILCAAASIPKFISYSVFASGGDTTKNGLGVVVWSQIELYVGITAACIPMLRTYFESTMRRLGFSITNSSRATPRSRTSGWNRANGVKETYELGSHDPVKSSRIPREADSESCQELAIVWEDGEGKRGSWREKELRNDILVTKDLNITTSISPRHYQAGFDDQQYGRAQ
jgi:hypothetical protein